jgi:hypothetical protein
MEGVTRVIVTRYRVRAIVQASLNPDPRRGSSQTDLPSSFGTCSERRGSYSNTAVPVHGDGIGENLDVYF